MASLDAMDPLAQLRDLHVPVAPQWWPPAPGWWLLALLGVTLAVLGIRFGWHRYRTGAPLRRARSDLAQSFSRFSAEREGGELAAKRRLADTVNAVLKRVALVRYPRRTVAELSGARWTAFLDGSANTDQFTTGIGRVLGEARFAPAFNYDPAALRLAAEHWIDQQGGVHRDTAGRRSGFRPRLKPLLRLLLQGLLRFRPRSSADEDRNP